MRIVVADPGAVVPWHDHYLCQSLGEQNHDVVLATSPFVYGELPSPQGYTAIRCFFPFLSRSPAFWARAAPLRQAARIVTYAAGWRRLRRIVENGPTDVVHLHWSVDPSLDAWLAGRLQGPKLVCSIHNVERRGGEPLRRTRWSTLAEKSDAVVVHSEAADLALRRSVPQVADRLYKVPLGPGLVEAKVGKGEARRRLGFPETDPLAIFFGLIRPYKGLEDLFQAWDRVLARLPRARLAVAGHLGQGSPSRREVSRRWGRSPSVRLDLRYIPQHQASLYLAAADVVVLPYREASQSAVLVSAYACGRPVVATAVAGLEEMVEPGTSGLLARPGDPGDLAEKLMEVLSDRGMAERMGSSARRLMEEQHSWPRVAGSILKVYREVLRG